MASCNGWLSELYECLAMAREEAIARWRYLPTFLSLELNRLDDFYEAQAERIDRQNRICEALEEVVDPIFESWWELGDAGVQVLFD